MSQDHDTRFRPERSQKGFSLIEVLMATLLLGYAVSSLDALFMAGQSKAVLNSNPMNARLLANEIRLLAQLLPKQQSGSFGATDPSEVLALDSLRGAEFSPPILANLTEFEDMDDWTQKVAVTVVELANLSGPTKAMPSEGLSKEAPSLYEVNVTISHLGEEVDTWSWWIRP